MEIEQYKNNNTVMAIRAYLECTHLIELLGSTLANNIIKYICDNSMMNYETLQELNESVKKSLDQKGYFKMYARQRIIFVNLLYGVPFTKTIQDYLSMNKSVLYKNSDFYHPKSFINDEWIEENILNNPLVDEQNVITRMALESFIEVLQNTLTNLGRL